MNSFFAPLYEFFYYHTPFSDDLFQEGIYAPLGLAMLLGSLLIVVLFYYIINRPSFSRWYHWMMVLGIHFAIQYGLAVWVPKRKFDTLNLQYSGEYWMFALMHGIISILAFTLLSYALRWWSKNCNRTPIPN